MQTAERRLTCHRCSNQFACLRDNIAACWCNAEPYRLPMSVPPDAGRSGDCFCPDCLRALAEKTAAANRKA